MAVTVLRAGANDYGESIKLLVVGNPGSGKTRSSSCWTDPLILNAEAGLMSVADRGTPNVKITSTAQVTEVLSVLQQPPDVREKVLGVPVRTVVLDTVDEIQKLFIKERLAAERKEMLAIADWGWLGDQLRAMIRALRNLDLHVVFNCHAKTQEDSDTGRTFVKPGLQGAMGDEIAGYVDLAVVLIARPVNKIVDGQNSREVQRFFQTYPDPIHTWVKDRSGQLPMEFPINFNDDFNRLNELVFGAQARKHLVEGGVITVSQPGPMTQPTASPAAPPAEPLAAPPAPKPAPTTTSAPAKPKPKPPTKPTPERKPAPVITPPAPAPEPELEPVAKLDIPFLETKVEEPKAAVATLERNPEGTYCDDSDAVAADCPHGYGCQLDKDMADLSFIRFRKHVCRKCFAEMKKK